ncbi:MAG TPA: bifunctional 4-hydroxy-2-oxoglutarate aldolase/2-dehydro-3-deoxy-phosphogluconate aldolase [Daejeonella sp.]|nr:bifunctional 4-hydroxy-2-oxoglutarate aldolase/2-dehydro-3-deoxy-phosphogluconate aldolase [Daejeonella sp.]
MNPLQHILEHQIVAIIRGANPQDILKIVDALEQGGVKTLEITLNSPKALDIIAEIIDKQGDKILVGAGTVLDAESARAALLAGARFIVSPSLNLKTIQMTKRYGAISIPGAFTPTEILKAYEHGGDLIKVFPANVGAAYLYEISGPLPYIPLLPTGGVNLQNIREFKKAGASGFGLGSSLVNTSQQVTESYLKSLTQTAQQFVEAVK